MPTLKIIDANTFRLYVAGDPATVERINDAINAVRLSSVTIEEMIVGRLNINRARSGKTPISIPEAHEEFAELYDPPFVFWGIIRPLRET